MAENTSSANAHVVGSLTIEAEDLKRAAVEASADGLMFEAFQVFLLIAVIALAAFSYWRHTPLSWSQLPLLAATIIGWISTRTRRAKQASDTLARITRISAEQPARVAYTLDPNGLVMQSGSNVAQYAWSACNGVAERRDTILVYFDKLIPDVLFKRAFGADDLAAARTLMQARVVSRLTFGQRASARHWILAFIIGIAIVLLGVVAALIRTH